MGTTKEAIRGFHAMLIVPERYWKKEDLYVAPDRVVRKEVSALMRWVDTKLLSEFGHRLVADQGLEGHSGLELSRESPALRH